MPVFVAAAVLYLSRSVARPLALLSEGAAAVARGDLDARIDIGTPDEFGALAAEFNAMTVALKRDQERLVESEKLAGIGRLAAGLAHELNNPLQVMLGYLSLNRDSPDPRLASHLAAVEEEAVRCKEIVAGLLELSRPTITPVPVNLRALCDDVAVGLRMSVLPATPRLTVGGAAHALGDGPKLRQVLFNLIKNAVESAGDAGEVEVAVGCSGDLAEVAVRDSGSGVSPEARARMFEPFFTTKPGGTGLGLAVSRAIARAHRGDIGVGTAERGGAVFTLRLPRARSGEELRWSRPGVLVVEDRPSVLKLMATILEEGYEVTTAPDGAAALALMAAGGTFDVVLTDVRMPGASGFDVLRAVQRSGMPGAVVMMTAYANVPDAVAAMKLGAYDYVMKPLDADEITLVVARAAEHAREGGEWDVPAGAEAGAGGEELTGFRRAVEEARHRASRAYLHEAPAPLRRERHAGGEAGGHDPREPAPRDEAVRGAGGAPPLTPTAPPPAGTAAPRSAPARPGTAGAPPARARSRPPAGTSRGSPPPSGRSRRREPLSVCASRGFPPSPR